MMGSASDSTNRALPGLPRHLVLIMDGNGRWAVMRKLPRISGHQAGVEALRRLTWLCVARHIPILTVFAFSQENWSRPWREVQRLFRLFEKVLREELVPLCREGVRLRFIGDRTALPQSLCEMMVEAERSTCENDRLQLSIATNYGGRWDICQASKQLAVQVQQGSLSPEQIDEQRVGGCLSLADLPDPDLLIRTGGEQRVSNYLLWQLAYTELYFSDCLWPDFTEQPLDEALRWYAGRRRRFGNVDEQELDD